MAGRPGRRRPRRATSPATGSAATGTAGSDADGPEVDKVDPLDVPGQSTDDTDAGWGERVDEAGHDRWLSEQRPPHWG